MTRRNLFSVLAAVAVAPLAMFRRAQAEPVDDFVTPLPLHDGPKVNDAAYIGVWNCMTYGPCWKEVPVTVRYRNADGSWREEVSAGIVSTGI